jgi:hypothetical protein
MTLYDFIQMDEMEQAEAVWSGTLAGTRHEGECRILLYKINEFYVEAWYHVEHNVLKKFRPFKNKELLQPYFNIEFNYN